MMPCIEDSIPIYVRNIFNPSYPGTVISGRACSLSEGSQMWDSEVSSAKSEVRKAACTVRLMENESPIRGITSIDNVAIVSVEGTGHSFEAPALALAPISCPEPPPQPRPPPPAPHPTRALTHPARATANS